MIEQNLSDSFFVRFWCWLSTAWIVVYSFSFAVVALKVDSVVLHLPDSSIFTYITLGGYYFSIAFGVLGSVSVFTYAVMYRESNSKVFKSLLVVGMSLYSFLALYSLYWWVVIRDFVFP